MAIAEDPARNVSAVGFIDATRAFCAGRELGAITQAGPLDAVIDRERRKIGGPPPGEPGTQLFGPVADGDNGLHRQHGQAQGRYQYLYHLFDTPPELRGRINMCVPEINELQADRRQSSLRLVRRM